MDIELNRITVRELVDGFENNGDDGVRGYGGKLDIRPPYQREFIYKRSQQIAVIDSILRDFPLNVMYWVARDDGTFEMLDGQQRTLSICDYHEGVFMVPDLSGVSHHFHGLPEDQRKKILDYELLVYFCKGSETERLDWFRVINIAGEKLNDQEMRNAAFSGPWVSDARKRFSRTGAPASGLAGDYVNGKAKRQDFLQKAIEWARNDDETIEHFMERHRRKSSAVDLWNHFRSIIEWVESVFPNYRSSMKGVDWGGLHRRHGDQDFDPLALEDRVSELHMDDEVQKQGGIYPYVLAGSTSRAEKHLDLRTFSVNAKRKKFEEQKKICPECEEEFKFAQMEGDHIIPWRMGGRTEPGNLQMLCRQCNRQKGGK